MTPLASRLIPYLRKVREAASKGDTETVEREAKLAQQLCEAELPKKKGGRS